jgi:beta-mannosidase
LPPKRYQAELIRCHVETLRRLRYRPTRFAQFCLADGHPDVTWSVLDHARGPKLGYEALCEACRPVIVVADRLPATGGPPWRWTSTSCRTRGSRSRGPA